MSIITFDACAFRTAYPQFDNLGTYPDSVLDGYFDIATVWLSNNTSDNCFLNTARLTLALNLLTAHLAALSSMVNAGNQGGIVQSATIDKVSVNMVPPPIKNNQFAWWINQTPYGAQFYALLTMVMAGGVYVGGRNELGNFRRGGGY